MRAFSRLFFTLLMSLCACAQAQVAEVAQPLPADVRVLIDISGSMKKTDPQNLRKPAMELLVQLMPQHTRAGIWTFGQSVNMLVPHKLVDKDWIASASSKSSGITSVALYTNIGKALEAAAYDSGTLSGNYRHNILLLTDGVVDISPDGDINVRERARILDELLPQLKSAGYIIHTIALSDAADQELMQTLSLTTDGVFAVADTAEELMSAFLRIFDQAVPVERLPMEDNTFLVDDSVKEFTALIFHKANAAPTVLISPSGDSYTASAPEAGVNWFKAGNYDLMTVQKPAAGKWRVKADFDADNRVTVVSDLQLQVASLANNLLVGQKVDLQFFFQEDKQRVTNIEFLRLLDMNVLAKRAGDEKQWQVPLTRSHPPVDGIYQQTLTLFDEAGQYAVRVVVDGKTFQREFKSTLTVISPFTVSMDKTIVDEQVSYHIHVTPDLQLVDVAKSRVEAVVKNSKGTSETHTLALNEQERWHVAVVPTLPANYSVELTVSGSRSNGAGFTELLPVQYFAYPEQNDPVAPITSSEEASEEPAAVKPEPVMEPEEVQPDAVPVQPASDSHWLLYTGIILGNVLIFGLAYVTYRIVFGKKTKEEVDALENSSGITASVDGKPAMQEVDSPSIDVSADNPGIAQPGATDGLLLDLDDLEDHPDDTNNDK